MTIYKNQIEHTTYLLPTICIHRVENKFKYLDIFFWKWVISITIYER